VLALFSWGLALVSAGIMARANGEACLRKDIRVHYPLLVASAFSGFVIWHQRLTSSVGLAIATPGDFLEQQIGLIETSATLFTGWNLGVALFVLLTLPVVMAALRPDEGDVVEMGVPPEPEPTLDPELAETAARRLERSPAVSLPIVAMGLFFLGVHFFARGRGLELNILNFAFLVAGVALAGSVIRYAEVIADGGRVAMGVALGDQWTNLVQSLVLVPVLTIASIGAREIMGYTFVALLWTGAVFSVALLLS